MYPTTDSQNSENSLSVKKTISEYITSMSHDLKTPLVAIVGIGEILKNELKDTEHQKLLNTLENATNTVLSLIKDVLSLSRIESDHLQVLFEPFDLLKLIEGVVSTMSHQCLEKGVELLISYPSNLPRVLIGDSSAIRRIVINLLNNAIKFTDRGYISIQVSMLSSTEKEAVLKIGVEDTGIGLPEDCLGNDLQNSVNSREEDKDQGAGLTLAIIKQLVHGLGGAIQIDNKPGEGTKFSCTIPFALKNNKSYLELKASHFKILLISDNPASYQSLAEILEHCELQICSSSKCLHLLKKTYQSASVFDIVIVDDKLMSPTLLSVAHKAKTEHWLRRSLFIYSSFPLSLTQMDQVRSAGFHEIISKPIYPSQLLEQLHESYEKYLLEQNENAEPNQETNLKKIDHSLSKPRARIEGRYQILLVEDNPIAGYITQCILEKLNCQVMLVENGTEALKLTKLNHYDIVFLDIDLPDIDGITICRILRAQPGLNQKTVIIALSGQIVQNEAHICLAAGMNAFLEKPASSTNFTQIIQQFLVDDTQNAA